MTTTPTIPRSKTFETLRQSRNEAAVTTLAWGLSSLDGNLRRATLETLIKRPGWSANRAILLNWQLLDAGDIELIRIYADRFSEPTCEFLTTGTIREKQAALQAVGDLGLGDAAALLVDMVLDENCPVRTEAGEQLLLLSTRWGDAARSDAKSSKPRNVGRTIVMRRLARALASYDQHRNSTVVEAWLSIVHWDDAYQRSLMANPSHVAYRAVLNRMAHSDRRSVTQLLAGYLWQRTAPNSLTTTLVERRDLRLAVEIANLLNRENCDLALNKLNGLETLACLKNASQNMGSFNVETQKRLWLLVAASISDIELVLRGALELSRSEEQEDQHIAAEMLRVFRRPSKVDLVKMLQSFKSDERTGISSLAEQIAAWVNSPAKCLQDAAKEFFRDFTMENLLEDIKEWPAQMCKTSAKLVSILDGAMIERLCEELQSPAPKRRLAALQLTHLVGVSDAVAEQLLPLLRDARLEVRIRAIDLLSAFGHESLKKIVPSLLEDVSTDIQDAAHRAVRRLRRHEAAAIGPETDNFHI
ncbi:MAG: hypothetical protein KDB22_01940 [Planctomycetales bacterium]|nr:hypothetical protein [Planctomycetales bacterium]